MRGSALTFSLILIGSMTMPTLARGQGPVVVAVPARAGAVDGKTENSDVFIWRLFSEFTAPVSQDKSSQVVFETWASDADTFSATPHWPKPGEPVKFQASVLGLVKMFNAIPNSSGLRALKIDVKCDEPPGAAVGGFPTEGVPPPCIAEQVARNRAQFDYIVNNSLNTKAGLAAAFKKGLQVEMPVESIAIKVDWVPLAALLQWVPQLGDLTSVRKQYYTTTVGGVEYAVVAMHVSSRQNPNWVWGTFEHQMNPGRCDYIGCFDTFGAQTNSVPPNTKAYNTQYGACPKTPQLKTLMANAHLSPVWENYCLKSTQVDYTADDGTPYVLGNSVIEGIVGNGTVAASSCISCHAYASFGPDGAPTTRAKRMLPFNPIGKPIPGVLDGSHTFAFMWGVLQAPK
jgi:hypothetical protein